MIKTNKTFIFTKPACPSQDGKDPQNVYSSKGSISIHFATTSKVKFNQYSEIFQDLDVELRHATAIASALIEPQFDILSKDKEAPIIGHPLRQAARFAQKSHQIPYMIEDTMLVIDAFSVKNAGTSGLPGADTKSWWRNLGAEGVLKLLKNEKNRQASFMCQIGLYLGQLFGKAEYHFEDVTLLGTITDKVRISQQAKAEIPKSNPYFFHSIFQPLGFDLSLAEMNGEDFAKVDYRRQCAEKVTKKLRELGLTGIAQLPLPFRQS